MEKLDSLKVLCIGKISTHIWINHVGFEELRIRYYPYYCKNRNNYWLKIVSNMKLTERIMQIQTLPRKIRLQISVSIITLAEDLKIWCTETEYIFIKLTKLKPDLRIRMIFTPSGRLDREKTLINYFLKSLSLLKDIQFNEIRCVCNISKEMVLKHAAKYGDVYLKNNDPFVIMCNYVDRASLESDWNPTSLATDIEGILCAISLGGYDVFKFFFNKVDENIKQTWLIRVLLMLFAQENTTTFMIMFIYENFDSDVRVKVLKVYGSAIVYQLLKNNSYDECSKVYGDICEDAPRQCYHALKAVFNRALYMYENNRHLLFWTTYKELLNGNLEKMLYLTPTDIKNEYITKENNYIFSDQDDFTFITRIITSPGINEKNTKELIALFIILNQDRQLDDTDEDTLVLINRTKTVIYTDLNMMINLNIKHFLKLYQTSVIFNIEKENPNFKIDFRKHNSNIIETIKFILKLNARYGHRYVKQFLQWCFEEKDLLYKFITEVLIYNDEFVKMFVQYVSHTDFEDIIFTNPTVTTAIKKTMRETNFIEKVLETLIRWKPYCVRHVFEDMLTYITKEEKMEQIRSYFLSENGLKLFFELTCHVETDYDEYRVKSMKSFVCCLEIFELGKIFLEHIRSNASSNGRHVYNKHFKPPEILLFSDNYDLYKKIVNSAFTLFIWMLYAGTPEPVFGVVVGDPPMHGTRRTQPVNIGSAVLRSTGMPIIEIVN